MLTILLAACSKIEPVPVDTLVGAWWHLADNDMNVFLQPSEPDDAFVGGPHAEGTLWYDFFGPRVTTEDNFYGGEWEQITDVRFTLDYFGDGYSIKAYPSDILGCYDLRVGFLGSDLACPYEGGFEGADTGIALDP